MAPQTSLGNILIVDDEEAITDLLSLNLRSEGYNVAVISRTSEVDLRELRSFHLVIVDGKIKTSRDSLSSKNQKNRP